MSRSTSIAGLTDKADKFIDENCQRTPKEVCECCGSVKGGHPICEVYDEKTGVEQGMFDDGPELEKYLLKDGKWVYEVVQDVYWSSGPNIFMCLQDEDGNKIFEWNKQEMERW